MFFFLPLSTRIKSSACGPITKHFFLSQHVPQSSPKVKTKNRDDGETEGRLSNQMEMKVKK